MYAYAERDAEEKRAYTGRERARESAFELALTFPFFRPRPSLFFSFSQDGTPIPVRITAYADKSYDYTMKTPPTSHLLKSAAGVAKGAQKPGHASSSAGSVSAAAVLEIARIKAADLPPHVPLRSVAKSVAATARSMGVRVVG